MALLLAASSGAVAAKMITGKQIKNNTVTGKDIKNKSLSIKDLSPGTVDALSGADGATGPAGPAGGSEAVLITTNTEVVAETAGLVASGSCPEGHAVLGAWAFWQLSSDSAQVVPKTVENRLTAVEIYSPGLPHDDLMTLRFTCGVIDYSVPQLRGTQALPKG